MGLFGDSGDETQIKITLDAVNAIEQAEKLQEKINKVGEAGETNSKKVDQFQKSLGGVKQKSEEVGGQGKGLTDVLGGMGLGFGQVAKYGAIATGVIAGISVVASASILKLAEAGNSLADVKDNFEVLGGSSASIEEANKRILGILPNIELYRLANAGLIAEIPDFNKNFGQIADYGVKVGDSLGLTATQGIGKVTQALISGKKVALERVGITFDEDKANREYAESMGIVGRQLTENEKKYAGQIAGQEALIKKNIELGAHTDNVVTALEATEATFTNQIGVMGRAVNENEGLTKAIRTFQGAIEGVDLVEFTSNLTDLAGKFAQVGADAVVAGVNFVNDFARGLRIVGEMAGQVKTVLDPLTKSITVYAKVLSGQLPSLEELKDVYGSLGRVEMPSFQKAVEKVNAEMLEKNALTEKNIEGAKESIEQDKKKALALKLAGDQQDKYNKAIKAQEEAEKKRLEAVQKSIEALKGLKGALADLQSRQGESDLQSQLEQAILRQDDGLIKQLEEDLRTSVRDGFARGFEDAGGDLSNPEALQTIDNMTEIEVNRRIEEAEQARLQETARLTDLATGLVENSIADAIVRGFEDGFSRADIQEMGASFGQAFGSAYFGPIGGAIGGILGDKIGGDLAGIGTSTDGTIKGVGTAIDTVFPGIGTAIATIGSSIVGGGNTPNEDALMGLDRWIEERLSTAQESGTGTALNLENLQTGAFLDNPNWADDMWSSFDERAVTSFSGLGEGLTQIAGITEDVGGQLGYILANNLNGNLDQARMLLIEMGIGAEDLEQAFLQIGLTGEQSWHTVETYMQSIGDLTGEGLIGIGDLQGAMDQFTQSGGRGQEALIALRNVGIEAMEAGASSMADLRTHLVNLGTFTSAQIDAIMGGFAQRGIDSLEGIRDASDRTLGGVTADAESLGYAWDESVGEGLEQSIKDVEKLKSVITELPDNIEKNITLKVKTEYSGDDARMLYSDLINSQGVSRG